MRLLSDSGHEFQAPARDESLHGRDLGRVIYCIGLTGDFRERLWDTVESHVCKLLDVVRQSTFETIVYVSSAGLYGRSGGDAREGDVLRVDPSRPHDLYTLSKAMGESIVLSLGERGRVVRPAYVYGAGERGTFLSSILDEAKRGSITLRTSMDSSRDFIHVAEVARLLVEIALRGTERIYNLASGICVTNEELTNAIAGITGCTVTVAPGAAVEISPSFDTTRIRREFGFEPSQVLADLPSLVRGRA